MQKKEVYYFFWLNLKYFLPTPGWPTVMQICGNLVMPTEQKYAK